MFYISCVSIKRKAYQGILGLASLYLILGNFPRFVRAEAFSDNLLLSEFFLYFFILICLPFFGKDLKGLIHLFPIFLSIIISFLWGIFLNGPNLKALMYAGRLCLLILSAYTLGHAFYHIWGSNISSVLKYFTFTYCSVLVFGMLLYLLFSESYLLWDMLQSYGIIFNGDPHVHRFVSTYFDPNFYAAIACFPILGSFALYQYLQKPVYLILCVLFVVSIILSGSRSGIGAVLLFLLFSGALSIKKIMLKALRIKKIMLIKIKQKGLITTTVSTLILIALVATFHDNLFYILNRLFLVTTDDSALARWHSFRMGLNILNEHPIRGVGYNFLPHYLNGRAAIDCSILTTLITFGAVLTFTLFGMLVFWATRTYQCLNLTTNSDPFAFTVFKYFLTYLLTIILFASNFNNILFYQFWLIPVFSFAVYLSKLGEVVYRMEKQS